MPYAIDGRISQDELPGGIEITPEQYAEALEGMLEGKLITVQDGELVVAFPESPEEPEQPPVPPPAPIPVLFASAGFAVSGGVLGTIELTSALASAYYEDGWMSVAFSEPRDDVNYLVFVQTDMPVKIEQFKDLGSFELIFSDPITGDPVEPGRIDLQLLKVTG